MNSKNFKNEGMRNEKKNFKNEGMKSEKNKVKENVASRSYYQNQWWPNNSELRIVSPIKNDRN